MNGKSSDITAIEPRKSHETAGRNALEQTGGCMLSEKEELLLMRFHDGDCGWFERWRAQRLVDRKSSAAEFIASLSSCQRIFAADKSGQSVDLWDGIQRRILAEERAALYTRERAPVVGDTARSVGFPISAADIRSRLAWRFTWAGSGAAVAALALMLLFGGSSGEPTYITPGLIASSRSGQAENIPSGSPQVLRESIPTTFQVDWMRGNGRVKLYEEASRNAPVIWVRRKDPTTGKMVATAVPQPAFPERFR